MLFRSESIRRIFEFVEHELELKASEDHTASPVPAAADTLAARTAALQQADDAPAEAASPESETSSPAEQSRAKVKSSLSTIRVELARVDRRGLTAIANK